ncbi:MAG: hypothetical protein J0H14_06365 [Alphaproteobacteria bacterium]|nr:hypothetical protein [Alphaproteobacteria bacterium]
MLSALAGACLWLSQAGLLGHGENPRWQFRRTLGLRLLGATLAFVSVVGAIGADKPTTWPDAALYMGGGLLSGLFMARFGWSIYRTGAGKFDPLIGAGCIALLVVVLDFPVFTSFFNGSNISTFKVANVLELGFVQRSDSSRASIQSASSPSNQQGSSIPRTSDPRPGLRNLLAAVSAKDGYAPEDPNHHPGYMETDKAYISGLEPKLAKHSGDVIDETRDLLAPIGAIANCLIEYVNYVPDSHLILLDLKRFMEDLFSIHSAIKESVRSPQGASSRQEEDWQIPSLLFESDRERDADLALDRMNSTRIDVETSADHLCFNAATKTLTHLAYMACRIRANVLSVLQRSFHSVGKEVCRAGAYWTGPETTRARKFRRVDEIREISANGDGMYPYQKFASEEGKVNLYYLQPYTSIALANMLVAYGASDAALAVLTEWLDVWQAWKPHLKPEEQVSEWLELRAEFEVSILLNQLVGRENRTYLTFKRRLVDHLDSYLGSHQSSLDELLERCRKAPGLHRSGARTWFPWVGAQPDNDLDPVRQKLLFLLLDNHQDLSRAEISFLAEQEDFSLLDRLQAKVSLLSEVPARCLPKTFPETDRRAMVAEYGVTAALVGLAVSDRMAATARSASEQKRADEVRDRSAAALIVASGELKVQAARLKDEAERAGEDKAKKDGEALWPTRDMIFHQSPFEQTLGLAAYAADRLNRLAK